MVQKQTNKQTNETNQEGVAAMAGSETEAMMVIGGGGEKGVWPHCELDLARVCCSLCPLLVRSLNLVKELLSL